MKFFHKAFAGFIVNVALATSALATTWAPQEFVCPVDGEKNTFNVVMSYGSYIYSWPEKYQWLFWPKTDSNTFYICKKCHYAAFMWDFDKLPKDKIPEIKKVLAGITVSKNFKEYNELPITERLEIIEKIYGGLGKDDAWWEDFYRLKGYHYGKAGNTEKAAVERRRALAIVQKEIADPKYPSAKKLLLYVSASLKHFLGEDAAAIADLETALKTKYVEAAAKPEDAANAETGLNERITDYIARIKSEKDKPRFFDKYADSDH